MSEITLDFPNSEKYEKIESPWDTLAAQKFIEVNLETDDEAIKRLKLAIITDKQRYQTLARDFCDDKEGTLTNDSLDIYVDEYKPRDERVEDIYINLTESQLDLIQSKDERDASSKREAAEEFANSINPTTLAMYISHEVIGVNRALAERHKIKKERQNRIDEKGWIKAHLEEYQESKKNNAELEKLGYNPDGPQTEVFGLILQQAKAIRYGVPTRHVRMDNILGYKRACDFQETMLLLGDEQTGAGCRQALKEAGYKTMPKSWDDEGFSTSDMAKICTIARSCETKDAV